MPQIEKRYGYISTDVEIPIRALKGTHRVFFPAQQDFKKNLEKISLVMTALLTGKAYYIISLQFK
jgi:hypothetical protein